MYSATSNGIANCTATNASLPTREPQVVEAFKNLTARVAWLRERSDQLLRRLIPVLRIEPASQSSVSSNPNYETPLALELHSISCQLDEILAIHDAVLNQLEI